MLNSLTAREREVAQYIADGLDNKTIANMTGVLPGTITNLLALIADKLEKPAGYSSRVWVARVVWEQGWKSGNNG